ILLLPNKQLYTGITANLKRRIEEHKARKSPFTKNSQPVKLIFYEVFNNKKDAEKRERYFKTNKGKHTLKAMLRETLSN
ncbi:MAG: GIY-YIG nuclease family protein, partial [Patescibacteria group bacterium]